jgi:hypothetical protein
LFPFKHIFPEANKLDYIASNPYAWSCRRSLKSQRGAQSRSLWHEDGIFNKKLLFKLASDSATLTVTVCTDQLRSIKQMR